MSPRARGDADPILAAKTVAQFIGALDDVYGWDLPRTVPPDTTLAPIWALAIGVAKDPEPGVLYRATATAPYPFVPALPGARGVVVLDVTGTSVTDIRIRREETTWLHPSSGRAPRRPGARPRLRHRAPPPRTSSSGSSSS